MVYWKKGDLYRVAFCDRFGFKIAICDLKEAVGISGRGRSRPGDTGMASTRSHNVSINPVFSDISQRDVDGIDMFPGRVEMVRSFRMAITPEVEIRFSVVADQAAAAYTEVTACQGGQRSAPK
jgi:hypothetical protein